MPRQRRGGSGQVDYGGFTSGGGPDASFLQNVSPNAARFNSTAESNPYADVGKFNLNVMSPAAFNQSVANNQQNGGLIHGMASGVFGPGAALGGVPLVAPAVMGAADILSFGGEALNNALGRTGDVLGLLGQAKINPFAGLITQSRFDQTPETEEKAAVRAQGGILGNFEAQAKYLHELDRQYAETHPDDMGPMGLFAINPELRKWGVNLGGAGDLGEAVGAPLEAWTTLVRLIGRGFAGMGGPAGTAARVVTAPVLGLWTRGIDTPTSLSENQIEYLAKRNPEDLNAAQAEAVAKYKSGEWSNDKALDFLTRNNAGLADNPIANIFVESALDPQVWGSLGAALFAKAAKGATSIQRTMAAIDAAEAAGKAGMTKEAAQAAGHYFGPMTEEQAAFARSVVGMDKGALEPLVQQVKDKVKAGTLSEAEGELQILQMQRSGLGQLEGFLGRTIGQYTLPVVMSPRYGPIARKVHNIIDPTRILFSEKSASARTVKVRLSTESTAAVTHAHGLFNTEKVYAGLERLHPNLVQKVMDDIGGYTAGLTRVWAAKNLGSTMLKKLSPVFGDVNAALDVRLENLPDDFFTQLEFLAVDVMPLSLTPEGVAERMAVAYGDTADTYLELTTSLPYKGLAYLHAATTQRARSDMLQAIAKQNAAGTWKHPMELAKLILIGPGELTKQRADVLLRSLKGLTEEEQVAVIQQAVERFDILRKTFGGVARPNVGRRRVALTPAEEAEAAVRVIHDMDGVNRVVKHVKALRKEKVLAAEMPPGQVAKLRGEVADWAGKYGKTADGAPMYSIGFRPEDDKLWRLVRDADTGEVIDLAPWVDYVDEMAPGYRPGYGRTLPGVAKVPADWLHIAKSNLFHSISTQRVAVEAQHRFIRIGITKLGLTEDEARLVHQKLDNTAQSGEHAMRGLSATDMWSTAEKVLPHRVLGKVGRRELVDAVLEAYKGEFHVVGGTQVLTGALKQYLDRIPIMNMGGGNYIGQISEKAWPNLKFKFNPYFMFQEMNEGQFFSILKGVMPFWHGAISQIDERAFRVWGRFDPNLESVGDQLERSVATLVGTSGDTLATSGGLKRIKYVNATRQFRKSLGEQARTHWSPEFLDQMRAHYHTMDDGEAVIRWLDDQMMENQRVIHQMLELPEGANAYDDIIKAAAWSKLPTQGMVAPLHMDEVARAMDRSHIKSEGDLIRAVRSKDDPLTTSDVANMLQKRQAHPAYIERVVNDLKFMGIENWWKRMGKAYDMTDRTRDMFRALERGSAKASGMTESEWISQRFSNEVKVFGDPTKLPSTGDILMNAVRMTLQEKNKVIYAPDDPDVLRMLQQAQEQYNLSVPNPRKLKELQGAHDRVHADPAAYSPGQSAGHTHTTNGRSHTTGEVDFATFAKGVEEWVGGGMDEATGQLRNVGAIHDATKWYRELPGMILGLVDGDVEKASKIYLAWTYSQKSDSPMQGFIRTMRAHDRHQFATSENMVEFMRDDLGLAREAIASVMKGEPVTSGLGIKLWDFSGAALGMNRRVVGNLMPSPADRWAFRGAGFMDVQGLRQFMRAYGYDTPEAAGYLDPAPYVQEVWTKEVDPVTGARIQKVDDDGEPVWKGDYKKYQEALDKENLRRSRMRKNKLPPLKRVYTSVGKNEYEYTTKWLNDMTDAANASKWMGKTDWQPRDLQALDWLRIQHAFGAYPESGADMMHAVSTQLALSVDPMKRGLWGTHIEDWDQFTEQDRADFVMEMAPYTAAALSGRMGIIVPEVHFGTHGAHMGEVSPWMALTIAGTHEPASRGLLSMMAMHQADYGVAIREVPDFKTARVRSVNKETGVVTELGFRHAVDFALPTGVTNDMVRSLSELAELSGETLVPFTRNGQKVVRWVWHRKNAEGRAMSTSSNQVNDMMRILREDLDAAGLGEIHMTARSVHVEEIRHDWATDPKGYAISNRLEGLGPAGLGADRELFGGGRFQTGQEAYRGATEGEHGGALGEHGTIPGSVSPLVGETRAERDRIVARYLRNPVRGRATPDGLYTGDTGAVNAGVHGFTVAGPRRLNAGEMARVQALEDAGDHIGALRLRNVLQGYDEGMTSARVIPMARGKTVQEIIEDMGAREMDTFRREDLYMIHPKSGYRIRNRVPKPTVVGDETGFPVVQYRRTAGTEELPAMGAFEDAEVVEGMGHDLKYVYRAISEEDYQGILSRGYMKSDERMNLGPEGTVASIEDPSWYLPGKLASSPLGDHPGRIVRIQVRREDGWKVNKADSYIKTDAEIPVDRIDMVSPKIVTNKYQYTSQYGSVMDQTHTYIEGAIPPHIQQSVLRAYESGDYALAQRIEQDALNFNPHIDQMRRRVGGAYLETDAAREGRVSLVPFDNMMRAAGMRPSMFAGLEEPAVLARHRDLLDHGFDEPIVLEYSIREDAVRFMNKDDRLTLEAAEGEFEYIPATVIMVEDFAPNHPQWANWPGENIFSPLGEEDMDVFQQLLDEGGVISPEDIGMVVDQGFGEGAVSDAWQMRHETSQAMTAHAASIMKVPGYPTRRPLQPYEPALIGEGTQRSVDRMIEGIYEAPGGKVELFSGQRMMPGHGRYENPEVGDVITMPLRATSPDREMAHRFSQETNWERADQPGFVFAFPEGTRGVVQDARMEIVVSGRFRVKAVYEVDPLDFISEGPVRAGFRWHADRSQPVKIVELEPVEIFNPHAGSWEPYHRTQPYEPDTSGMTYLSQADEVVRGASSVGKDGRITLWASKDSASPMVFAHEMAHAMHVHLDPSMRGRVIQQFNAENKRRLTRWNREVSEWFAESYVRYLREGSSHEDPEMQRAFRYFAKWTDSAIKKGLLKGETNLAARGALSAEEGARLQTALRPGHKAILDEITAGPKRDATHFNATEESVWHAATDAVRAAGYDAFRVNFFKRNRTLLERTANHPMFGLYPASYMWGKVLPEMVRFIAKDPFGMPGGHVAWLSQDVWRSIHQQTELDPEFSKAMDAIGKNGAIRFIALSLPASPWESAVNSAAWTRRLAQAGLENEARVKAGLKPKEINYAAIWQDTMQYQFGAIPNMFDAATKGVSGLEDLYALGRGEPTTGKKAPTIGQGLETITDNFNSFGEEIGEGLPSITDVFSTDESNVQDLTDITSQKDELQSELDDAQMQLQTIFERYPFTQQ